VTERRRVRVEGIVQGVGYRPFVYGLAQRAGVTGFVGNDAEGVFAEVEGDPAAVAAFVAALRDEAPPLAVVESVTAEVVPPRGDATFVIVESRAGGEHVALISPDMATCDDCLAEMADPSGRRHRYPFTNCTNCGPRFTITTSVPYDRPFTTMAGFEMCADCKAEYHDPADRRFHAQPICCPACGPTLTLVDAGGQVIPGDPLAGTARLLNEGAVVGVKGLGGYHLAARADHEEGVAALRARKHREDKPFAVMVPDLAVARRLCAVDEAGAALLTGPQRPIVLLPVHPDAPVAAPVAPGNRSLGLMLPYTPLHHLLLDEVGAPVVLTSGNVSDEPIAYRDGDAFERLDHIADAFLTHDRPIHIRTDDSVTRPFAGRELILRRARGHAPRPLRVPWAFPRPVLATGAELKSTFCLAKDHHAFVSHHIGDLENYETLRSFTEGIDHFRRLFDVEPEVVAHDLHPEYLSTKHAHDLDGLELTGVQHHHAHIASCLADNGETGPAIGVAFDGLGYGTDGTIWGGEFLLCDLAAFERVGHLATVPMPGGTNAIREPWRMAAAYLDAAFDGDLPAGLPLPGRHPDRWDAIVSMARSGVSAPLTSSAGRLFDAVAAIIGLRDRVNYEGQAAIELEQRADLNETGLYRLPVAPVDGMWRLDGPGLVRRVAEDHLAGVPAAIVAARFHNAVAAAVVETCLCIRDERGLGDLPVALSGGVFQNLLLLERVVTGLDARGVRALVHSRVPPNDGGISLGQAAVAGARDRNV
jgi:hydrogenase maturation protein HypF